MIMATLPMAGPDAPAMVWDADCDCWWVLCCDAEQNYEYLPEELHNLGS